MLNVTYAHCHNKPFILNVDMLNVMAPSIIFVIDSTLGKNTLNNFIY